MKRFLIWTGAALVLLAGVGVAFLLFYQPPQFCDPWNGGCDYCCDGEWKFGYLEGEEAEEARAILEKYYTFPRED